MTKGEGGSAVATGLSLTGIHAVVFGATGFVGRHVVKSLRRGSGVSVLPLTAPRLLWRPSSGVGEALARADTSVKELAKQMRGADVVINAAGVATAGDEGLERVFGANALLPLVLQRAATEARARRFIHVSSAAVQGRMSPLTETAIHQPFSVYSASKALAEDLLLKSDQSICFRPTSVHGQGRSVTAALAKLARSPGAVIAGPEPRPTPQVLVENVSSAIAYVATYTGYVPPVVLQPNEGLSTADVLRILGRKEPRVMPERVARPLVNRAYAVGRILPRLAAQARRLEMLMFGQDQSDTWLRTAGWRAAHGLEAWYELG